MDVSALKSETTPAPQAGPRRVVILGATGSIGQSTADVIAGAPGWFEVEAVVGGRDAAALAKIARTLKAKLAVVADPDAYGALRDALAGSGIEVGAGRAAAIEAALRPADIVVGAIAGAAGVEPTHAAVARRAHRGPGQQGMPRVRRPRVHARGGGGGGDAFCPWTASTTPSSRRWEALIRAASSG